MHSAPRGTRFLTRHLLLGVVFVTGACVLIVEVLAARILSPYFGNSIFTFSSVIASVLAALGAGYHVGGRTADRHPREALFYGIIAAGGLSVIVLAALARGLLPLGAYALPPTSGPLVCAVVLFVPPSFLLGSLAPFAVKLQQLRRPEAGIGSLAGSVFFWSTLGSILGSLVAGFVLIPRLGVRASLLGIAGILLLIGGTGLARQNLSWRRRRSLIGILLFVVLLSAAVSRLLRVDPGVVFEQDGTYERITVLEQMFRGRPVVSLMLDCGQSSAIYTDSDELVHDYARYFRLVELYLGEVRQALVIGAGAYTIPRALLARYPGVHVDVVEIEPRLHEVAQRFFRLEDHPRMTEIIQDGRRFLHDTGKRYDLIFADANAANFHLPAHLATREFFALARDRLSPGGVFVDNLLASLSRRRPSLFRSQMRTLRAVFPNSHAFAVRSPVAVDGQNLMLLGVNGDATPEFCAADRFPPGDPFGPTVCESWVDPQRFVLSDSAIFTDDRAPVEIYVAPLLARLNPPPGFSGEESAALLRQLRGYRTVAERSAFLRAELRALGYRVDSEHGTVLAAAGRGTPLRRVTVPTDDLPAVAVGLEAARQLVLDGRAGDAELRFVDVAAGGGATEVVVRDVCETSRCVARDLHAAGEALLRRLSAGAE